MKPTHQGVKVSIMGRDFVVACPEEERQSLGTAATYLDQRMREVQKSGRVVGLERCAIMAALNITHDLLVKEELAEITSDTSARIKSMCDKIDASMHSNPALRAELRKGPEGQHDSEGDGQAQQGDADADVEPPRQASM